jgi:hypothetical protein
MEVVPFAQDKPPRLHGLSLHQQLFGDPHGAPCGVQLWGQSLVVTSVASPATGNAIVPARSPSREEPTAREKAWWEPGLGALRTMATREGLPGAEATTTPRQAAKEERQGSTWGMS